MHDLLRADELDQRACETNRGATERWRSVYQPEEGGLVK